MTASRMTAKRFAALMMALTRADNEWEAEENDLDNYGGGPEPSEREALAHIREERESLEAAREILNRRFPTQADAYQRSFHE